MSELRDISPCSCEENQYEVDIITNFIEFLTATTGILWVKSFNDGSRPSDVDTSMRDGQYGVINIDSIKVKSGTYDTSTVINENKETCTIVSYNANVNITLKVYKYVNMANSKCTRIRTSSDVLSRMFTAYQFVDRLRTILNDRLIGINSWGEIINFATREKNGYEHGSMVTLESIVTVKTSFTDDYLTGVDLQVGCDPIIEEDC